MSSATLIAPRIQAIVNAGIIAFMPRVARTMRARAMKKLGIYQPGWPPLAASTLERKRRRKMVSGRFLKFSRIKSSPMPGIGDTPLVDLGEMGMSTRDFATGNEAHVTMDFPMNIHEQDALVGQFSVPPNNLPARPLLGPTLADMEKILPAEIEAEIARLF